MATALQPTEVDLALDLSADTDFGDISYTDHDADTGSATATQQTGLDAQAQILDQKQDPAGSLGVHQQVNIGSDVGDEFPEDYQYDDEAQASAEGGVQEATNDFEEWEMEADADEHTAIDASTAEEAHTLDGELAAGLEQGSTVDAEGTNLEDGNEAKETDGYDVNLGDITGTEGGPTQAAEEKLAENGANGDFFQEIDYEDDGAAGSPSAAIEEPQSHAEEAVLPDDTTAADPEKSWPGNNETDKIGAIDEYHRSLQDQALDEILQADSSAVSLDTPVDGEADNEAELPEVIVTWHGVDYPLFYDSPGSDGKQCFFEDASLLQCAMEQLLASFRRELSSDLVDTDELVLQINEMGLEFAESTDPDHFRDITLGSIMQVFNDLVRNKDPEASRPLYAYLITRPKCSTRWQALIEDAYQGKNIDEVSIYFSMDQGTAEKEADHSEGHEDGAEDQMDEMETGEYFAGEAVSEGEAAAALDSFAEQSEMVPDDGEQPYDEMEAAEGEDAHDDALDDAHDDEQTGEDVLDGGANLATESSASLPGLSEGPETSIEDTLNEEQGIQTNDDIVEASVGDEVEVTHDEQLDAPQNDGNSAHFLERSCYAPDICFCEQCLDDTGDVACQEESSFRLHRFGLSEAARIRAAYEADGSGASTPCISALSRHAHHISDTSMSFSFSTTADGKLEAANEAAAATDAAHAPDEELDPDSNDIFGLGEPAPDNQLSETSGTATLEGDNGDEPNDFGTDIDFNADISRDLEHDVAPATVQDGELDEIDWRDYAGQDEGDDVLDVASTSAKRPRSDEDDAADAENGQDPKRHRSEA